MYKLKVWIIHDSQYGNGKKLAETMGEVFEKEMEVKIDHNKYVTPVEVIADSPELIVIGSAVRSFTSSPASKKWIRQLHLELKKTNTSIRYGLTFLTHGMPFNMIERKGIQLNKLLARSSAINEVYTKFLSGQVIGQRGPFEDNVLQEIKKQAAEILDWVEK